MNIREEFEKWWEKESEEFYPYVGTTIGEIIKGIAFEAWINSRSAIEIELPKGIITDEIGPAISKENMMSVLSYNGIKIKEKTK